jgi:hypothetical protein
MCFSSTAAMAIKYLNPTALLGSNADDDYLKRVLRYGDTTEATAHLRAAFDYGVKATFLTNGTRTTLEKELDAGYPVACGMETKEFINGKWITIQDTFKDYDTAEACIEHLITLWYKDYKTHKGVNRATSWEECCRLLQKEGYATDPKYPQKLITLIKENN